MERVTVKLSELRLVLVLACLSGCAVEVEADPVEGVGQAVVFKPSDNRIAMNQTFFNAHPNYQAVGYIWSSVSGTCTGTKVYGNYVLTAAHCFPDNIDPLASTVYFFPAFQHIPSDPNNQTRPRISASRIIRGTNGADKIGNSAYEAGNDWALLVVDPATYTNGTAAFPNWDSYPSLDINEISSSSPTNVSVDALGYSADLIDNVGADYGGAHLGCLIRERETAYVGVYRTDCDQNGGASGGPVIRTSDDMIVAVVGGGLVDESKMYDYSAATANLDTNTKGVLWAPWDPGGIAGAIDSAGRAVAFASDKAFFGQLATLRQLGVQSLGFDRWFDFRSGSTPPAPLRMSAVRAGDSLLAVLSVNGNDGQVYQNVQLSGGSWEGWRKLFGGQSQSVGTLDVASLSTSQITIYNFLMRANGAVYTRRKIGGWSTSWKGWQDLSAPLSSGVTARALSAHHTQGFPVLFLATSNGVKHAWSNDLSGDVWTSWVDLGDGLPSTIKPIDIEAGETSDGKLDVFLLAKPSASEFPQVYRRTKVNNLAGSNWSAWSTYLSVGGSPALKKATAIGLLPPNVFPKGRDNLLLLSDGRVFYSAWTAGGTSRGFLPFYGPKN